ncbi:hypothetical protein [Rhodoferax sp.]|uniref:hypothetical protein n=1 Tax=Rhodoferax sp. TaxID=50421 RepID=UPI00260B5D81|nr:hypothetical protein [Rhodoferax sp.]MDD2809446.1 hypothetical protein [Rhodoferax sp.]
MATLESRIMAMENKDDGLEILNPRWGFDGLEELSFEEHERLSAERIDTAVRAGKHIIRLQPLRNFD